MPLPIKSTWSFRRTPNANGKNTGDLDRTHQNSSLTSLKAERSNDKTGKSNRHWYSCERLQIPDPPPSPILNGLPPAVPPKTSCDPACTSFVVQERPRPKATTALKELEITEMRRVPSCQVAAEDIVPPLDNALLPFFSTKAAEIELLSLLHSLPAAGPRQQTTLPCLDSEAPSAQVPSSHPLLVSSEHAVSEILINHDFTLSVGPRRLEDPPVPVRSVKTWPVEGVTSLHFDDASTTSEGKNVEARSDAKEHHKVIPGPTCNTAPSSSEPVIKPPTALSASLPCSFINTLSCVEDPHSPLSTAFVTPSIAPFLSQNKLSSAHFKSKTRTLQPKRSPKLQQAADRLKSHLPSQPSWRGPLTSRRTGQNVSRNMESWSPDSRSSSASGSYMTDAATVVGRLFNNPLYSDLALSVDGTTFHVHRGILAEHCAYFRKLFDNARSRNPTTEIKTVDCTFKPVTVERARRVIIARAKKGDHEKKVDDEAKSQRRENSDGSGSASDMSGKGDRRDMAANDNERGTEDTISGIPSLEMASANVDPSTCRVKENESGSIVPDGSSSPPTEENPLSVFLSSSSKSNSESSTSSEPVSATKTFSAMFVSDERNMGYTSHHFALFLQQLYGILDPTELDLVDLLPVLRIAYIHGVPGLIAVLADQIFDSLTLSVETWPAAIRFAERYQLQDIRRRALEHASADKSLWKLAVEMLSLEDFKVFLRGIGQAGVGRDHKTEDLRGVKDELLMMFLLVHYQEATSVSHSSSPGQATSRSSSSSSSLFSLQQQCSHKERIPVCYASDDPSLARRDSGGSEGIQPVVRQCSRDGQKSNGSRIRKQLQTPSLWNRYSSKPLRLSDQVGSRTLELNMAATGQCEQSLQASEADPAPTDRADNAKSWMIGFKRECGWDGRLSYLD